MDPDPGSRIRIRIHNTGWKRKKAMIEWMYRTDTKNAGKKWVLIGFEPTKQHLHNASQQREKFIVQNPLKSFLKLEFLETFMVVSKTYKMNDEKCSQIGTLVIHPSMQKILHLI